MHQPHFVVTGCSRSGTSYMAKILSALAISCGHEQLFNIYRVSALRYPAGHFPEFASRQGDSSFLAAPFLDKLPSGSVVFHQVRHPLAVIRSHMGIRFFAEPYEPSIYLADCHLDFLKFLERHCPGIFKLETEVSRTMRYWVLWNTLVERAEENPSLKYLRYQVETLNTRLLKQIVNALGHDMSDEHINNALSTVAKTTNTRLRDHAITWRSLPDGEEKDQIINLALRYGYTELD